MTPEKPLVLLSLLLVAILTQSYSVCYAIPIPDLLSHSAFVDSANYYHVVGEIRNSGTSNIQEVELVAVFYDKAGKIIGTNTTYSVVEIIQPGAKSPFEITFFSPTREIDDNTIDVRSYRVATEEPYALLHIVSCSNYTDSSGHHQIAGEIHNTGSSTIQSIQLAVTYYDASNTVIAINTIHPCVNRLKANQKSPFEAETSVKPHHFSVVVATVEETTELPYSDFLIFTETSYIDSLNSLHVLGEVKNTGVKNATNVEVIATFYDASGNVVAMGVAAPEPPNLGLDSQGSFELITVHQVDNIDHYTLQVQAQEYVLSSTITGSLSSSTMILGSTVTISGAITPIRSSASITLTYLMPNGTLLEKLAISESDGSYSHTYTPPVVGWWRVTAHCDGDAIYEAATTSSLSFLVSKIPTTVSCTVSPEVTSGCTIMVVGSINPLVTNQLITVTFHNPQDLSFTNTVMIGSDGCYRAFYTPNETGSWTVFASYGGDAAHHASTSHTETLIVKASTGDPDTSEGIDSTGGLGKPEVLCGVSIIGIILAIGSILFPRNKRVPTTFY